MEKRRRQKALESVFGKSSLSGDSINCAVACPVCDDKNKLKRKLIVRLDDGRYQCWVCGTKGSNILFLAKKHFGASSANLSYRSKKSQPEIEDERKVLTLPPGSFFLGNPTKDPDVKAALRYLAARGLTKADIYRWRMLSSTTGRFRRRIIIPSFSQEGSLNYFVSRSIDKDSHSKYVNSNVPKKEVVFNEIDIDWQSPIQLVEGAFDAVKSPENTIPILGSSLSKSSRLFHLLTKNGCDVNVSLDPDLKSKAYFLAKQLSKAGCSVRICFAPENTDLGSMQKKEAAEVFSSAKFFDSMLNIQYKISRIKSGSIL